MKMTTAEKRTGWDISHDYIINQYVGRSHGLVFQADTVKELVQLIENWDSIQRPYQFEEQIKLKARTI